MCIILLLAAICALLGWNLLKDREKESKICQNIVDLGNLTWDDDFLETAKKMPGLRSLSPVLEIDVQIRVGDYTMSTVLTGIDFEEYRMKVVRSRETEAGETPALVLGEKSLSGLMDSNGHLISAGQLKKLMGDIFEQEISYRMESAGETETGAWKACRIAGVTQEPEEGIYIPYEQARRLAGQAGADQSIHKVLLTVQGEEQMERAQSMFGAAQTGFPADEMHSVAAGNPVCYYFWFFRTFS